MKGVAGNLGVVGIQSVAGELEGSAHTAARDELERTCTMLDAQMRSSAEILLELAEQSLARSGQPVASVVRPLYLRPPDTAINWSTLRREALWPDSA